MEGTTFQAVPPQNFACVPRYLCQHCNWSDLESCWPAKLLQAPGLLCKRVIGLLEEPGEASGERMRYLVGQAVPECLYLQTPGNSSKSTSYFYYSVEFGPVHSITLSPYADYTPGDHYYISIIDVGTRYALILCFCCLTSPHLPMKAVAVKHCL